MAKVQFPVEDIWISFDMQVVKADVPILICIDGLGHISVYFYNLTNQHYHLESCRSATLKRINGHPFFCWSPVNQSYFTSLQRLHHWLGHPAAAKLANLLLFTELYHTPDSTRRALTEIEKHFRSCQTYNQDPCRFKFRLKDDVEFNHMVYLDIFYIQNHPVLHFVDEATHYRAASLLPTAFSDVICCSLRRCWIDTYLGPSDVLTHDADKTFIACAFKQNTATIYIRLNVVPVEFL